MSRIDGTTHLQGLAAGPSCEQDVKITASTTSGVIASVKNPEPVPVFAKAARIHVKVGASAACEIDMGTAATNVLSDNMIDGASVNTAANTVYDAITDGGSNGKTRQYVGVGQYFTAAVASGDANGLVANFKWDYELIS